MLFLLEMEGLLRGEVEWLLCSAVMVLQSWSLMLVVFPFPALWSFSTISWKST